MKEIIYKVSFEKYHNVEYDNSVSIADYSRVNSNHLNVNENLISAGKNNYFTYKSHNLDHEFYVKNYGNPLCSVNKMYTMIVVERNEHKVSLKVFNGNRNRRAGVSWFKVKKEMHFLTINLNTGDIYVGDLKNYQNKKKFSRSIKRNFFYNRIASSIKAVIKNNLNYYNGDGYTYAKEAFDHLLKFLDNGKYENLLKDSDRIFKFYLDKRKIKYPNNFGIYSEVFAEKEFKKILQKNDHKLVESFMIHKGLKGKKIKKYLHSCEKLNVNLLKSAQLFFGEDWVNQEDDFIVKCLNFENQYFLIPSFRNPDLFSKEEIRKIFNIFKCTFFDMDLDIYTFFDHIDMYSQLKRYGEDDLRWMSSTIGELRTEHMDWSNKLEFYRRGNYNRIYPNHYYEILKNPIVISNDKYYPVILDHTASYNEESNTQSNCVKTYIGKSGSIIISLRKNSPDSDIRSTLEYRLSKSYEGKVEFRRAQSLGKFNQKLDECWDEPLLKLDELFLSCIDNENYHNVKITKTCVNGTFFESDSEWDEQGKNLKWTYKEKEIFYDF
jgi:hypothetical protein